MGTTRVVYSHARARLYMPVYIIICRNMVCTCMVVSHAYLFVRHKPIIHQNFHSVLRYMRLRTNATETRTRLRRKRDWSVKGLVPEAFLPASGHQTLYYARD